MTEPIAPKSGTPDGRQPTRPAPPPRRKNTPRRVSGRLVALSSAAILTVYAAGYARTQSAADQIAALQTPLTATTQPTANTSAIPTPFQARSLPDPTPMIDPFALAKTLPPTVASIPTPEATRSQPTIAPAIPTAVPTAVPTAPPTATPTAAPSAGQYRDGSYTALGRSRHGNVQVSVVVKGGKIVSAQITRCTTRYPCSLIQDLPQQVITRQSDAIDLVSGATDSSEAFQQAVTDALSQAS